MKNRTLGIDLGTNSIGWAIVENNEDACSLLDVGALIFQEGVAREKGQEKPAVEARTNARGMRRHYFRRRMLKVELLKVLVDNEMCPFLSGESLKLWLTKKIYPTDPDFLAWQKTNENDNPYFARHTALNRTLNLETREDRYLLGRALYHLAQRRGFLSNRKDQTKEREGEVKTSISDLSREMGENNCDFLGELFFKFYNENRKIRSHFTDRVNHIEKEFYAICRKQNLSEALIKQLHRAIFYQRPLKSQKGLIGKCIFESGKSRCAISHPAFEEYRMLGFINNVKVKESGNCDYRPLSSQEKDKVKKLFFRKSKETFDFEDIAKEIAGKGNYSFRDDKVDTPYKFNYRMATSVAGCPVTTGLISVFGDDWKSELASSYSLKGNKDEDEIINDVWHALYSFDSDEKLALWAKTNLHLTAEKAKTFTKIKMPQGYASLSLKAIKKILPFLRIGLRYDEAVFVANLDAVLPEEIISNADQMSDITDCVINTVAEFNANPLHKELTKQQAVRKVLEDVPGIDIKRLERLYHPSKINTYPDAEINSEGLLLLGSPRTSAVRNPMAMRALFKLRHLINRLLREGKITRDTRINIEFARGLNDANKRKAIERYQRENEKTHKENALNISRLYKEATGIDIVPTETDILKYQLWEEQGHICLYTGDQIAITDFIGANPKYDIEHTVPRSLGGDDAQVNKTLCNSAFNRFVKKSLLPSKLTDYPVILERIESLGWQRKIDDLANQIAKIRTSGASTKEIKDGLIQKKHYLKIRLEYLREKLRRFTLTEVPEGFSNRQGVDIGIIGKYAREYLKTLFNSEEHQIFVVKGLTTAEFRKMWGLQQEYTKKERINHTHHAIDAITIACIGRKQYRRWAEYLRAAEAYKFGMGDRPVFEKPWPTFAEDVKNLAANILVVHDYSDNTLKQTRKILRIKGKKQFTADGKPKYQQGDSVRAKLHKETFYGAIDCNGEIKYVLRVPINSLSEKDIDKIVDPAVREKVKSALAERGFKHLFDSPIWMNKDKGIEIKKVRVFTPSVTKPLHLKKHRDMSRHEYKREYHVANDSNYCMAIYEGTDKKGKPSRSFLILNNLEAIKRRKAGEEIVPLSDSRDMPLKWLLKLGTLVLFYENSPAELLDCSPKEMAKRLYKVTGLSTLPVGKGYGSVNLRFHQEARPSTDSAAKNINGRWTQGENIRPGIIVLHTQFNALVEGQDFIISESGVINFLHSLC